MKSLIQNHVENLKNNGFTVIKNKAELINPIRDDVKAALKSLIKKSGYDLINLVEEDFHKVTAILGTRDRGLIGNLYDITRTSLNSILLISDESIKKIISQYIRSENLSLQLNDQIMRIDLPNESNSYKDSMLLPWHQDYPYNQGSVRSLTIYIPLQSGTSSNGGTLEVTYGSHKKSLVPHIFRKQPLEVGEKKTEGLIYEIPNSVVDQFKKEVLYLDYSDILIFDMDTIHRSVQNLSDKARFNLQIRLSDLNDQEYCARYSTIKTLRHKNLTNKQQELIKEN